jgi:hypothetical protein
MSQVELKPFSWERMIRAVEKVRARLMRAVAALEGAGIPYAVAGGNAVASWVSRVDEAAVRNTQDVDILLRRSDFDRAKEALEAAGFVHYQVLDVETFLDGPDSSPRDAVHVLFAGEKVRKEYAAPAPDTTESAQMVGFLAVDLEPLIKMKLTSYRLKDRVHIQDMIGVGLIDQTWPTRFDEPLRSRLQALLDNPHG